MFLIAAAVIWGAAQAAIACFDEPAAAGNRVSVAAKSSPKNFTGDPRAVCYSDGAGWCCLTSSGEHCRPNPKLK